MTFVTANVNFRLTFMKCPDVRAHLLFPYFLPNLA